MTRGAAAGCILVIARVVILFMDPESDLQNQELDPEEEPKSINSLLSIFEYGVMAP